MEVATGGHDVAFKGIKSVMEAGYIQCIMEGNTAMSADGKGDGTNPSGMEACCPIP